MSSLALTPVQHNGVSEYVDWEERKRLFAQAIARNATPGQIDVVIAICRELGMNPLTNHINLIDGQAYITHKGLLHVAHRSGQLNGIVIVDQGETETHYTATVSVFRKDMDHAFTYPGRYPKGGRNKAYGPEMALTRAETMALRRAFDVALGVVEELNDPSDVVPPTLPPIPPRAVVVDTTPLAERTMEEQAAAIIAYLTQKTRTEQRQQEGCAKLFALTDELPLLTDWRNAVLTACQQEIVDESWQARMTALGRDFSGAWVVEAEAVPTPASYAG